MKNNNFLIRVSNIFIIIACVLLGCMLFLAVFGWHITTPWSSDYNQLGLSIVYGTTHVLLLLGVLLRLGLIVADFSHNAGIDRVASASKLLCLAGVVSLLTSTLLYGIIRVPYKPFDADVHVYGRQPVVYKNYTAPTILFYSAIVALLVAVGIRIILGVYKRKHKLA